MISDATLTVLIYSLLLGVFSFTLIKSLLWAHILYISSSEQVSRGFQRELWQGATPWFVAVIFGLVLITAF